MTTSQKQKSWASSGTWLEQSITARRVNGCMGRIVPWICPDSRMSKHRVNIDCAWIVNCWPPAVTSNVRVNGLVFCASACVRSLASNVQRPLVQPCLRTSKSWPSNRMSPCSDKKLKFNSAVPADVSGTRKFQVQRDCGRRVSMIVPNRFIRFFRTEPAIGCLVKSFPIPDWRRSHTVSSECGQTDTPAGRPDRPTSSRRPCAARRSLRRCPC